MSTSIQLHDATGIIAEIPGLGVVLAAGNVVPPDNSVGYSPGCLFIQTDGTTVNTILYGNIGTQSASNFDALLGG